MKIALVGSGKTGSKVAQAHSDTTLFNRSNLVSLEKLKNHDVIISFLPGDAFLEHTELFLQSKLPVVTGSTGFTWPEDLNKRLTQQQTAWIHATNFSLGMNLVRQMIGIIAKADHLFKDATFTINEIHHTKKLDAPSGTALSWQQWSGHDCEITSERTGDVVGIHELTMQTKNESIFLRHEAKDRGIFAEGALWSANYLLKNQKMTGLHAFADVILKELV